MGYNLYEAEIAKKWMSENPEWNKSTDKDAQWMLSRSNKRAKIAVGRSMTGLSEQPLHP